mmetsp:Transcript_3695/g.10160  ORF Transcript_3695/g.10160 Transcript_3695/m.10160 type:complete len:640 (-) Transcript_3695:21-1940(-)|eukprot:CAMPEP_0179086720 /NCGR_PEP_ID=MMETSP0796-20121207/39356_1 /TAXON_ID=73915 /ORGANISM="Pyrodinium bahamense, Strain pbaha01" /LENGTH=639 /DNA_ID=CAMNT_0020784201 /DNA_START=45 /DNA_END=1964 /DNA_ORIENTATION=-
MEKRSWPSYDDTFDTFAGPDEKRSKASLEEVGGETGLLEAEFYMEQRLVGWIIGRGGSTLKEIEQAYTVKIAVDQSTKDAGYSKLKVSGPATLVQQAAEHMNTSLARAVVGRNEGAPADTAIGPFLMDTPPGPGPEMYEEMHIEQRFVGWLLGKSGAVVREIETQSGCKISMNQGTRNLGFTVAQLHGNDQQRSTARQLMEASLERAKASGGGASPRLAEEDLQVEQRWVGWLLGKGGGLAKEIEQESGAKVTIDQSTKSLGFSTVKIVGEVQQVEAAKARVTSSLQKVGGAPLASTASITDGGKTGGGMQVQIDQQWIGWLLGKGGTVVKEIETASGGAKVSINQDTKALGYSVATISGTPQQVAAAYDQMGEKLRRVNPAGDGLVPIPSGTNNNNNPLAGLGALSAGQLGGIAQQILSSITRAQAQAAQGLPGTGTGGLSRPVIDLSSALSAIELQIEQKWIGWLLGSGGKTVREIESETGAKISIDQSTKDLGFSTVKVSGGATSINLAQQRIQASLSLVAPTGGSSTPAVNTDGLSLNQAQTAFAPGEALGGITDPFGQEPDSEIQVEQKWVGWLLGKSGIVLKEIELQSGASIKIDQSTKEMGYSTVRIVGDPEQTATARQLIQDKISQARAWG